MHVYEATSYYATDSPTNNTNGHTKKTLMAYCDEIKHATLDPNGGKQRITGLINIDAMCEEPLSENLTVGNCQEAIEKECNERPKFVLDVQVRMCSRHLE